MHDLCTGDGLCQEYAPAVFFGWTDGLYYVKEANDPTGLDSEGQPKLKMGQTAVIPNAILDDAVEAALDCPGSCIFIEEIKT